MAQHQTHEELAAEYRERLGPELGPFFHCLLTDFWHARQRWQECRALVGTSEARIDLLNEAAGQFFRMTSDVLIESTALALCRLTDHRRDVVSVCRLPALTRQRLSDRQRGELEWLVAEARSAAAFAKDLRDNYLAHRNQAIAVDEVRELDMGSRAQIEAAMKAIYASIAYVHREALDMGVAMDVIAPLGGAESLLYLLRDGLRARAAKEARIEREGLTLEDVKPDPID